MNAFIGRFTRSSFLPEVVDVEFCFVVNAPVCAALPALPLTAVSVWRSCSWCRPVDALEDRSGGRGGS